MHMVVTIICKRHFLCQNAGHNLIHLHQKIESGFGWQKNNSFGKNREAQATFFTGSGRDVKVQVSTETENDNFYKVSTEPKIKPVTWVSSSPTLTSVFVVVFFLIFFPKDHRGLLQRSVIIFAKMLNFSSSGNWFVTTAGAQNNQIPLSQPAFLEQPTIKHIGRMRQQMRQQNRKKLHLSSCAVHYVVRTPSAILVFGTPAWLPELANCTGNHMSASQEYLVNELSTSLSQYA